MQHERRTANRFTFLALPRSSEIHAARAACVTDLTISGCYLRMTNPLPEGAPILVKIRTKTEYFQCRAKVVHSNQGDGMGVVFP